MFLTHPSTHHLLTNLQSEGDQVQSGDHKGYPTTSFSLPTAVRNVRQFNPSKCSTDGGVDRSVGSDTFQTTYDWASKILGAAAESLVALKGSVKVEFLCAELFSELQLMRNGEDHHRPKEFPRSFLRVWMSNIP